MAHESRVILLLALLLLAGCDNQSSTAPATSPTGPAEAVQSSSYRGVGVVKRLDQKTPAIEIDHQDIEGLMPAMQMEFPVTDPNLLNGLAVNDEIEFTVDNTAGIMRVTEIRKK